VTTPIPSGTQLLTDVLRHSGCDAATATGLMHGYRDEFLAADWPRNHVQAAVAVERGRQDAHGRPNHRDTLPDRDRAQAQELQRRMRILNAAPQTRTWQTVLLEAVYDAMAATDPAQQRDKLVTVAAHAVAWTEAIDRRHKRTP
jgi:hypothetical protein